jgi:hypothetical protein
LMLIKLLRFPADDRMPKTGPLGLRSRAFRKIDHASRLKGLA